jgi:hypothetical protein
MMTERPRGPRKRRSEVDWGIALVLLAQQNSDTRDLRSRIRAEPCDPCICAKSCVGGVNGHLFLAK